MLATSEKHRYSDLHPVNVLWLFRLCEVSKPGETVFDGEDLLDTLLGKAVRSRTEPIFFERPVGFKKMPMPGFEEQLPDLAVRKGQWKLLSDYDGSRPQLYDLSVDPGEQQNLASTHPEIVKQLYAKCATWHKHVRQGQDKTNGEE
jgi:hypothetical protein